MKDSLIRMPVVVKKSPIHGYGVFAACEIPAGTVIEECHFIPINSRDDTLENYYFWCDKNDSSILPLGFAVIYNHSSQPNAEFEFDGKNDLLVFKALENIPQGQEILVSYGENWLSLRKIKDHSQTFGMSYKNFLSKCFRFSLVLTVIYSGYLFLSSV